MSFMSIASDIYPGNSFDWLAKLEGEGRKASGSSGVLWYAKVQSSYSGEITFQLGKCCVILRYRRKDKDLTTYGICI